MQEVIGSNPLSSTSHKSLLNRGLRYLTTFVSAVNLLVQSWKFFHETMNRIFRMPRKPNVFPSYLLHKQSGQARVRVDGKDHLLGPYGSDESRIRYGQLVSKFAGGQQIDPVKSSGKRGSLPRNEQPDPGPTVGELCVVFLEHAKSHYTKAGKATSEICILKSCMRPLNDLYGRTPAAEFGPLALKAVREKMITFGWKRTVINSAMSRIRRIFKYAVGNELIEPAVLQKLQALAPLLAGRTQAAESEPRSPVDDESLQAVRDRVSPLVRDLIDLQNLTGARSGELLGLSAGMIDRSGEVWLARLHDHKTAHHGAVRELVFGPESQRILQRHLPEDPDQKLFPITGAGYRRSVTRACEAAGIARWIPHQLRHTFAHRARAEAGLEAAQAALGHRKADMTQHYAGAARSKAVELAKRIG